MDRVDILLATYNGEQFIRAQISSLIGQQYLNWRLLVHDDGSSDHTLDIVRYFSNLDERIVLIEDGVVCGGAARNFLHLLSYSDAEYIMFCDQDDIWFDNKIVLMKNVMDRNNSEKPVLVLCQAYVWYPESKGIVGKTISSTPHNVTQFIFSNAGVIGCSGLFNKEAKRLLMLWDGECSMHDYLIQLICVTLGKVDYMDETLMLYRQHNKSVTPNFQVDLYNVKKMKNRSVPVVRKEVYNDIIHFVSLYEKYIPDSEKIVINTYLQMPSYSILRKILTVIRAGFGIRGSKILLIIKILCRIYIK